MAVQEMCVVPSYVEVVSMASSDSGKIMVAYQVGGEPIEFCYADEFIERMQTHSYVNALVVILKDVFGDDDGKD